MVFFEMRDRDHLLAKGNMFSDIKPGFSLGKCGI